MIISRLMTLALTGTVAVMTDDARASVAILDFNDRQITASVPNLLLEDGYVLHSASGNFRITVGEDETPGLSRRGTSGRITLTLADDSAFHLISFWFFCGICVDLREFAAYVV